MEIKTRLIGMLPLLSILLALLFSILQGCASSDWSRGTAEQVDSVYQDSNTMLRNAGRSNVGDDYQNATQTTRGVFLGGATGAVAGGLTSGIGALPGAAGGAIVGGLLGAYIDRHTNLIDQLENRGVRVIVLGDQMMLVLSSARLFKGQSSSLKYPAYSTLDLVAQLLNKFTSMLVKVNAYTNDSCLPAPVSRAISQQQANNVVKYLWPLVNTRLMSARGYGGSNLVVKNNPIWDSGDNYRVEIILELLPPRG